MSTFRLTPSIGWRPATLAVMGLALMLAFESASGVDVDFSIEGSDRNIGVMLNAIDPLEGGFHYEGWAIIDGAPLSTGKFNVDADANLVDTDGNPIAEPVFTVDASLAAAEAVVITIEPAGDSDVIPADSKYLGGAIENGMAELTTAFAGALGSDFLSASGSFILATPTNGPDSDENSGIWFLEPQNNTLALDFDGLEALHNGFHYEGWAIIDGAPVSTGKFNVDSEGNLVDLEGNVIENGEFVTDSDLGSATDIVLTIEPEGDIDAIPAASKYLGGSLNNGSADLSTQHPATLNSDYTDAEGSYILATPTNGADSDENSGIWFLDPTQNALVLEVEGLEPLANGFHYEGWAIVDGAPLSTGKFNIADDGEIIDLDGAALPNGYFLVESDISSASDIVITIEPDGDTDALPAESKILGGPVADGAAALSTGHPATLNSDFSAAAGSYILATPTNGADSDENSGIWFLDNSSGNPLPGLTLPLLPAGWKYEGWVVIDGQPVSTGTFSDPAAADESAPFSGSEAGPPFPGEDFLLNAPDGLNFPLDLAGMTTVISVEPFPDDSEAPFLLKPLVGMIPADADDHVVYTMDNNAGTLPTASATIMRPVAGLNLPALPEGWAYEGWVVIDGMPVTTGAFRDSRMADEAAPYSGSEPGPPFPGEDFLQNAPGELTFPLDLAGATAVVSIEPVPDDSPLPFTLKPLVGAIPTDATDHTLYAMNNNAAGFVTGSARVIGRPGAGLDLPELPAGWAYEGWVVIDGQPVSTGRFTDPAAADDAAPFSGAEAGPPFPGEDFLMNAPDGLNFPLNLAGATAVISIEPVPDDSPAPFTLKPLAAMIPADAIDHQVYEMSNNADVFPDGSAELMNTTSVDDNPLEVSGLRNYPNPFAAKTTIRFSTEEAGTAVVKVYTWSGREVRTLHNGHLSPGFHELSFDGQSLPAGSYLFQIETDGAVQNGRMTIVR